MRLFLIAKLRQKRVGLSFLFVCLVCCSNAIGQTVTGTIKNEAGTPLSGISIVVKDNPSVGTTTNASGNYTLNLPAGKNTLTVSSIGFKTQEVLVNDRSSVDVVLVSDKLNLDEVLNK